MQGKIYGAVHGAEVADAFVFVPTPHQSISVIFSKLYIMNTQLQASSYFRLLVGTLCSSVNFMVKVQDTLQEHPLGCVTNH